MCYAPPFTGVSSPPTTDKEPKLMASVEDRIFELAQQNLDLGRDPNWDLPFGDSDVSSMDVVAFVKLLDPEFGIQIPPDALAEVDTLRKLAKVVADLAG